MANIETGQMPSSHLSNYSLVIHRPRGWEKMESARPAKPTYGGRKGSSKRRKKSTGSLDDIQLRSVSEGSRRKQRRRNVSRDSSTGSSVMSLDVRCACQYYQSNSLLPEKINPVGLPHIVIRRWYVRRVFINRRDGVTSFGRTLRQFFCNYHND